MLLIPSRKLSRSSSNKPIKNLSILIMNSKKINNWMMMTSSWMNKQPWYLLTSRESFRFWLVSSPTHSNLRGRVRLSIWFQSMMNIMMKLRRMKSTLRLKLLTLELELRKRTKINYSNFSDLSRIHKVWTKTELDLVSLSSKESSRSLMVKWVLSQWLERAASSPSASSLKMNKSK